MIPSINPMPEYGNESSVELVIRAQSGDADALNRVLDRYVPRLRRWARGRLPRGLRSLLDTNDIVQDAVISTLRRIPTLEIRSDRALELYLRASVTNRIKDLKKRALTRPVRAELPQEVKGVDPGPLVKVIAAQTFEQFERALSTLNGKERLAILLRLESGLSYDEIARQLRMPSGDAARMAISRGLMRLAERMGTRAKANARRSRSRGSRRNGTS